MFDFATIIGIIAGFGVIGFAITNVTDDFQMFVNYGGLLIVLGGLFASLLLSFKFSAIFRVFHSLKKVFVNRAERPSDVVKRFVEYAKISSDVNKSFVDLEPELSKLTKNSNFEKEMLELLIANYKKEDIQSFIMTNAQEQLDRESEDVKIFRSLEERAPAFGMIGTIIGLIIMFHNMGSDISSIGPAMAIALTTTLYGVIFSSGVFGPIADKISRNIEREIVIYRILLDGITYLHEKRNYIFMRDALNMHLITTKRIEADKENAN